MSGNDNKQWFQQGSNPSAKKPPMKKNIKKGKPSSSMNAKKPSNMGGKKPSNANPNQISKKQAPATSSAPITPAPVTPAAPVVNNKKHKQDKKINNKKFDNKKTSIKKVPEKKVVNKVKPEVKPTPVEKKAEVKNTVPSTVDSKQKKNRQKKAKLSGLKTALIASLLVLMALGVMVFTVHHLLDYFAVKPEMAFIEKGAIEHTIGAKAIIVRSESVISTAATGDLVTQTTEGSRVYAGQKVALVVPEDMQSVVNNLRNTQSQISEVQQELISAGSAPEADAIYDEINTSLVPIVDMIRADAMDGNISDMASYMSSISVLINQRETSLSALEFDDERLRELRVDETSYNNQLQNSSAPISTTKPGIISFKLDGLEDELSFNVLLEADPSVIREYINSSTGLITSDLYIDQGENVARIASNEEQYLAVYLKAKDASVSDFQVGTLHTLNVRSEGVSIGKCKVERCVSTDDGMLVVFSTTHYVEDLLDLRTADIEIVITETAGLRVPTGSLVDPDYERGVASVYVNNQGFADKVPVIIEDYDREFAIISPLGDSNVPNTQTVLITNPESIKPGEKVDK